MGCRPVPVVSIAPDGTRTRYPSIKEAAEAIGTCYSMVWRAANFDHKLRGMDWEVDEE